MVVNIPDEPLWAPVEDISPTAKTFPVALIEESALKLLTIADVPDNVGAWTVVVNIPDEPRCSAVEDTCPTVNIFPVALIEDSALKLLTVAEVPDIVGAKADVALKSVNLALTALIVIELI